ncbi:MAG: sigma-70 family RNA polymerase sigma factor, partial [Bacteroidetes bacterium]|nr:sigma-70 family RNA polymerase sigma factor [Bacteroidota bacterium]
ISDKARHKRQKSASDQPTEIDDAILERIYRAEVYRELHAALEKLPDQCRRVMQLSYLEGLTVEETAKLMQISTSAVKTHRTRVVKQLRKLLSDQVFSLFFFL